MLLASGFVYQRKVHFFQSNKKAINEAKERTIGFFLTPINLQMSSTYHLSLFYLFIKIALSIFCFVDMVAGCKNNNDNYDNNNNHNNNDVIISSVLFSRHKMIKNKTCKP